MGETPTTFRLTGEHGPGFLDMSDPIDFLWDGTKLTVEIEGTLPANDYNIDGIFTCRLSRSDALLLRDWLSEALA